MKYCPYCGAGLDEDMRFCPKCGKHFEDGKANPHLDGKTPEPETASPTPAVPFPAPAAAPSTAPKKKRGGLIAVIVVVALLAIVGGLFASGAFRPKEEPKTPFSDDAAAIEEASRSVVLLNCYDKDGELYATGSGFAIFDEGVIVTNYHVIADEVYRVEAQIENGGSFLCPTVLAYDAEKDIAILKADRETGLTLLMPGSTEALQKGEKVVAIGSPLGLINSVSTGVFSGFIDDKAGKVLQFTAAISHGSSGGALFNDAGEVIGITFASLEAGQSLNLGVPIEDAKALYNSADSAKAMSMEAFYDTFEHVPPIYSIVSFYENCDELIWKTVRIEGYSSYIQVYNSGKKSIIVGIVTEKEDVLRITRVLENIEQTLREIGSEEHRIMSEQLNNHISFNVSFPYSESYRTLLAPGQHVVIEGTFNGTSLVNCELLSSD